MISTFSDQFPMLWNSALNIFSGIGNGDSNTGRLADPLPAPVSASWVGAGQYLGIFPDLKYNGPDNDIVQNAFSRALAHIKDDKWFPLEGNETTTWASVPDVAVVSELKVSIKDTDAELQHGVDETYSLKIDKSSGISISAKTVWGALHALTTFEQLVLFKADSNELYVEGPVSISDGPKYPYRGVMIDTARNFYSVDSLLRQLDAMALAKMNVFHWHLTDTQAWPVFVKSYPDMIKDAYSPREVYKPEDIKRVVDHAHERGIRVVPELDIPGHSNSGWRRVKDNIIACGDCPWDQVAVEPNPGQLEVLQDDTYETLRNVYNDISEMFPDNFFHVGLDELNTGCYDQSESIQAWLKEDENRNYSDVAQYWIDHAFPIFKNRDNRQLVMWEDAVLSPDIPAKKIPKDVILQAWNEGVQSVKELASRGYDVIISSADFLYLDCGFAGWLSDDPRYTDQVNPTPGEPNFNYGGSGGSWCGPYKSWQRIYSYDFSAELTKEEQNHIIGGTANLWSEQSDGTTADFMIWPRTAAYGELLWSGNKDNSGKLRTSELTQRILNFRERLVRRGVNAAALMPKYCAQNPGQCKLQM